MCVSTSIALILNISRDIFRTFSNVYDGAFDKRVEFVKVNESFCSSYILDRRFTIIYNCIRIFSVLVLFWNYLVSSYVMEIGG